MKGLYRDTTVVFRGGSRILWRGGGALWNLDPLRSIPKLLADAYCCSGIMIRIIII